MTRFAWLLAALVTLFLAAAVSGLSYEIQTWFEYVEPVAYAAVMLVALVTVSSSRAGLWTGVALGLPAVAAGVWEALWHSQEAAVAQSGLSAAFLLFVAVRVTGHLLGCRQVDADALCASASAYLVFGVAWAALFSLVYDLDPDAFLIEGPDGERSLSLSSRQSVHVLYFSVVTLTTLGYGDVAPLSAPARVLAMLEAVVGQLYLAMLVARLVGLHLRPGGRERDDALSEAADDEAG